MYKCFFLSLIFFPIFAYAQINAEKTQNVLRDSIQNAEPKSVPDSLKTFSPSIQDYQKWNSLEEKKPIDTTLSIQNFYQQNVYLQDNFSYQLPSNWGKPLIPLSIEVKRKSKFVPTGKSYFYTLNEAVNYYDVKTPITRFIFENGVREGQFLSTLFTHNPNQQINYAINFNSLRSQGFFQRELVSMKNLTAAVNYKTKNQRYQLETNFISQSNNSDENAGLDSLSIKAYQGNNPDFSDLERLTPNLKTAKSEFQSNSFFINHHFGLFRIGKDSLQQYPFRIYHQLKFKKESYNYAENSDEAYYKFEEFDVKNRKSAKNYKEFSNQALLGFSISDRLKLQAGLVYSLEQNYLDTIFSKPLQIPQKINENRYGVVANAAFLWRDNIQLKGNAEFTNGENFGSQFFVQGNLVAKFSDLVKVEGDVKIASEMPSYNLIFNQNFYKPYNFFNADFKNENTQNLRFKLKLPRLSLQAFGGFYNVLNYTYLNENQLPEQSGSALNYFKVGGEYLLSFKKFHFLSRAQYQQVTSNAHLLPLPNVVARLTSYYQSPVFSRNAELQAGFNVKWHTRYKARLFSPILNEFYLQKSGEEIALGNYPQLDVFANLKVRSMRIYFRAENLTSFILPAQNLIMPNQAFRNFKLQIGVHWVLFN